LKDNPGGVVIKGLRAPLLEEADPPLFVYTERLSSARAATALTQELVPFILQQEIRPKLDVRVTVVDDQVFAAQLASVTRSVDWRTLRPPGDFKACNLPEDVENCCVNLVEQLGLRFGAIDLAIAADGTHYFLEINPNGEWGWLQKSGGLP
jgi:glutathione synthase/RimK-type ligase-like ATP-grasp enzyme